MLRPNYVGTWKSRGAYPYVPRGGRRHQAHSSRVPRRLRGHSGVTSTDHRASANTHAPPTEMRDLRLLPDAFCTTRARARARALARVAGLALRLVRQWTTSREGRDGAVALTRPPEKGGMAPSRSLDLPRRAGWRRRAHSTSREGREGAVALTQPCRGPCPSTCPPRGTHGQRRRPSERRSCRYPP